MERKLCYKSTAIELLGVTKNSFEKLNLKPVKKVPNPHYKSGPPSQLFDRMEIEKLIGSKKVKALQPKPRKVKDYTKLFINHYQTKEAAIPKACEYLFSLNRYCKHDSCSAANREEIYSLKHSFMKFLYNKGFAKSIYEHVKKRNSNTCYNCDGTGIYFHPYDGPVDCLTCDGTGYIDDYLTYVFVFDIEGTYYTWHLPKAYADFDFKTTALPEEMNPTQIKEVKLNKSKFKEGKELIKWVCL